MKRITLLALLISTTANAGWYAVGGTGVAQGAFCSSGSIPVGAMQDMVGCWNQSPLPYTARRNVPAFNIGLGYQTKYLGVETAYHYIDPMTVSGEYVADRNYNAITQSVATNAPTYRAAIIQRTSGVSLSLLPTIPVGRFRVFGRVGGFAYQTDSDFITSGCWVTTFSQVRYGFTSLYGAGVSYRLPHGSVALETVIYRSVNQDDAPYGRLRLTTVNYQMPL